MARTTTKSLADLLGQVQAQLAALTERLERLEAAAPPPPLPAPHTAPPKPAGPDIAEDDLIAISAALGAYLGVRVRIKQIRLLSSHAWAQQGRVSIQASHNIHH
jgi:methylmalonyl-CoA carboxyltransferase large subunit